MIYHCRQKKALWFRNRAADFLKAYTSNDPSRPRTAFLDIHGKIVAAADQFLVSPDEALVVIEKAFEERLRTHLDRYLPLYGTEISAANHNLYFDLESAYLPASDEIAFAYKKGQLIASPYLLPSSVTETDYRLFRVKNALPLQGADYDRDLLLSIGDEEFVSYEKGCYVGQEIISRIHFRGKPPKKLVVRAQDACAAEDRERLTSTVRNPQDGKTYGFLMVQN